MLINLKRLLLHDVFIKVDEEQDNSKNFFKNLERIYSNIPVLLELDGDQRFLINSHLSIDFLYGNVEIERACAGFPHLKEIFSIIQEELEQDI